MSKRIIFITGADHSGSTLVGCILGANTSPFKHFHVGEIHAYFRKQHKLYGNPRKARKRIYGQIWDEINPEVGYGDAYTEIFNKSNAEVIIDSSKAYRHFNIIKSACKKQKYPLHVIISYRPFAKIYESDIKRDKSEKNIINNIARYIDIKNNIIDQDYQYTIINMEHLIMNPRYMTKCLCERVGIPYFEGKESYWKFPSCHLYGSRTQTQHLKNPENAKYDQDKVISKPEISHAFLEREDIHEVESFLLQNALTCK